MKHRSAAAGAAASFVVTCSFGAPAATPASCPFAITEPASIDATGTQRGQLAPSDEGYFDQAYLPACGAKKAMPPVVSASSAYRYKAYRLMNRSLYASCVTAELTLTTVSASPTGVRVAMYAGAFDPENIQSSYLDDVGATATRPTARASRRGSACRAARPRSPRKRRPRRAPIRSRTWARPRRPRPTTAGARPRAVAGAARRRASGVARRARGGRPRRRAHAPPRATPVGLRPS